MASVSAGIPYTCLLHGIDTLEVSYFFDTSASIIDWDQLHFLKLQAGEAKRKRWSEITLGSQTFHVMPNGTRLYSIILKNDRFTIRLGEKMSPNCCVKFSSEGLWRYSAATLLSEIDEWARSLGLVATRPPVVSRVDWAFDFYVPAVDFGMGDFVSKSVKDSTWRARQREQTFVFGKGDLVIRVYDKAAEIEEKSEKAWFHDLWDRKDHVWRIEFQARREHLKLFGIRTPNDLFALQYDVLRAAARHTTLRRPSADSNRSRWSHHPLWAELQRVIAAGAQTGVLRSFDPANSDQYRLFQQLKSLAGTLKGVAAREAIVLGLNVPPELDDFLAKLPRLLIEHLDPQDWHTDVQAKMDCHRMGHR